jgi:hypothetical protein
MIESLKPRLVFLVVCLLILGFTSKGKASNSVEIQLPITGPDQRLLLTNPTQQPQSLWITKPVKTDIGPEEQKIDLPAHSKLEVSLAEYLLESFVTLEGTSSELTIYWKHRPEGSWVALNWGTSNEWRIAQGFMHLSLWIANPTGTTQKIQIQGPSHEVLETVTLKSYETQNIITRGGSGSLLIVGELRVALLGVDDLLHVPVSPSPQVSHFAPQAKPGLFEVTNADHSESFVVQITDAKLLLEARHQVEAPNAFVSRLLIAEVSSGNDGVNQDPSSRLKTPWSWHVHQVYRFADFGSIDCDGNPSIIEKALPWWQSAKGGLICFWGYKITRELNSP